MLNTGPAFLGVVEGVADSTASLLPGRLRLVFALAGAAWQAWALFAIYGLFFGLTEGPEKALVAGLAPAALRGWAFRAYHFAIGVAALPASIVFGAVWEAFGSRAAFGMGAGIALLAALLLPVALPRTPSPA